MLNFNRIYIGVDPATGEEQRNDYTAIVVGMKFYEKIAEQQKTLSVAKIYVLPEFVNAKMDFGSAIKAILNMQEKMKNTYGVADHQIKILIENGGQQKAFYDSLKEVCTFPPKYIEFISTKGMDKRSRTAGACSYIQSRRVLLPKRGMEDLTTQLLYFGAEKHDDLSDAFSMMVNFAMSDKSNNVNIASGRTSWPMGERGISQRSIEEQIAYYENVKEIQAIIDAERFGE